MFKIEQNQEELNKIMGAISDKHDVLSDYNEETNNVQLEEEIYQQMSFIKLEDLNVLPLEEIRRKLHKKYRKMTTENKINEIGEEIDLYETETNLIKNVVSKLEEFGEPCRRNTHFLRPRYVLAGRTSNFFFGFIPRKTMTYEEISLTPISQTGYILNIDEIHNREEIIEHCKRGMNSILTLNTTWTTANFLTYIEHNFSDTVADWYDSLSENGKNSLRIMETLATMYRSLCKEIKTEFIEAKRDYKEK